MTNKPMLSVELELRRAVDKALLAIKRIYQAGYDSIVSAGGSCDQPGVMFENDQTVRELRALLDAQHVVCSNGILCQNSKCAECGGNGAYKPVPFPGYPPVPEDRKFPAAQHQGEPVAQSEFEPDAICLESDGCPTEGAVLKRFWRENQPDPVLCEFYEAEDFPSLVRELVGHVAQLQEAAKRNVKPWEDTFPPTLLPAYIARINAEKPAPAADHTQCEECKGWGYHENHYEGGGTECGECGGSGNASVELVMPERLNTEGGYSLEAETWYNLALDDVAGLNGVTK